MSSSFTPFFPPLILEKCLDLAKLITENKTGRANLKINLGNSRFNFAFENAGMARKPKKKSTYKHIPHREKPAHLVEKRNARERRRVEAVNGAFLRLRRAVPVDNKRGKRVSKVKILTRAIDYILNMKDAIDNHDGVSSHYVYDDKDDDQLFAF